MLNNYEGVLTLDPEQETARLQLEDARDTLAAQRFISETCTRLKEQGVLKNTTLSSFPHRFTENTGGTIVIMDAEKGVRHTLNPSIEKEEGSTEEYKNLGDRTLTIRDPAGFFTALQEVTQLIDSCQRSITPNTWLVEQDATSIMYNATPFDLLHPEQYLKNEFAIITDESLNKWSAWTHVMESPTLNQAFYFKHHVPAKGMESPHELRFACTNEQLPSDLDVLPVVRYGRISEDKAIIFALQMPPIGQYTERALYKRLEKGTKDSEIQAEAFRSKYKDHKDAYIQILGEIPQDILEQDNPEEFVLSYYHYLLGKAQESGYQSLYSWAYAQSFKGTNNNPMRFSHYSLESGLEPTAKLLLEKKEDQSFIHLYEERRDLLKRFNTHLKGDVPTELRQVPPAAVVSLTAALKVFCDEGITDIAIPMYLPLRSHKKEEDIDTHVLKQLVMTCARVEHEVEGVEIVADPDADGYLHLKLGSELRSSRPLLKEVLEGFDALKQEV